MSITAGTERRPSEDLRRTVTVVEDPNRIIVQDLTQDAVTVVVSATPIFTGVYGDDIDEFL